MTPSVQTIYQESKKVSHIREGTIVLEEEFCDVSMRIFVDDFVSDARGALNSESDLISQALRSLKPCGRWDYESQFPYSPHFSLDVLPYSPLALQHNKIEEVIQIMPHRSGVRMSRCREEVILGKAGHPMVLCRRSTEVESQALWLTDLVDGRGAAALWWVSPVVSEKIWGNAWCMALKNENVEALPKIFDLDVGLGYWTHPTPAWRDGKLQKRALESVFPWSWGPFELSLDVKTTNDAAVTDSSDSTVISEIRHLSNRNWLVILPLGSDLRAATVEDLPDRLYNHIVGYGPYGHGFGCWRAPWIGVRASDMEARWIT